MSDYFDFVDVESENYGGFRVVEFSELAIPKHYWRVIPRDKRGNLQRDDTRVFPVNYRDFNSIEDFANFVKDNWFTVSKFGDNNHG